MNFREKAKKATAEAEQALARARIAFDALINSRTPSSSGTSVAAIREAKTIANASVRSIRSTFKEARQNLPPEKFTDILGSLSDQLKRAKSFAKQIAEISEQAENRAPDAEAVIDSSSSQRVSDSVAAELPSFPLAAWFLGPKAEQGELWLELLNYIIQDYLHWRRNYFPNDPAVIGRSRRRRHVKWIDGLNTQLDSLLNDLKAHFPFYSPRYLAHMLSEQTLPSVLGYFAGMLYNPNNVTDEAAPVTVSLELEVGNMIAEMLGYSPKRSWAHICSGGTIANIEALWVARTVQFVPFTIRDLCRQENLGFTVKLPNGQAAALREIDDDTLLAFRPNESIFMPRKFLKYLTDVLGRESAAATESLNKCMRRSRFNVQQRGLSHVLNEVARSPIIFVSEAAHYSVRKAANALGYGEQAIRTVPVTERFRIKESLLADKICSLGPTEYVVTVIAIVGTTEEGAVDPVHQIQFFRNQHSKDRNRSFWLHADAAWGGYFRTMFKGVNVQVPKRPSDLQDLCRRYADAMGVREEFPLAIRSREHRKVVIAWNDPDVYAAFLALSDADSITVDPHKMGYVPYPAGVVAFRNGLVTELIEQRAQYISEPPEGLKRADIADPVDIRAVGPYILEGCKPGAAAASCWLAHKTIPLIQDGHGKIAKTTLLNARRLVRLLHYHKHLFMQFQTELWPNTTWPPDHAFTFVPIFEPDTNVVCYVARPMACSEQELVATDVSLSELNRLNRMIYTKLSLPGSVGAAPYTQPYFVSRTVIEKQQYSWVSIEPLIRRLQADRRDYEREGLFVLRSTIMNPLYHLSAAEGKDHLYDFLKHLHRVTYESLRSH